MIFNHPNHTFHNNPQLVLHGVVTPPVTPVGVKVVTPIRNDPCRVSGAPMRGPASPPNRKEGLSKVTDRPNYGIVGPSKSGWSARGELSAVNCRLALLSRIARD